MSLDALRTSVLERARADADALTAAAAAETADLLARTRESNERLYSQAVDEAERRMEEEYNRELGKRQVLDRMEIMAEKKRRLDALFATVRRRFLALPAEERAEAALAWLEAEAADVGGTLRVAPGDLEAVKQRLGGWNARRAGPARALGAEADATVAGGARIVAAALIVDCTLDGRLARLRERLVAEASARLFG